ncbi:DUF4276 family protein [Rohdeia mirabilis]
MKVLLEGLLPRLFPELRFFCVPHEGKQDLEKSVPRKLRAWREPGVRFVVIRDNDGGDCAALKQHLQSLCSDGQRKDSLVRIACQELEAWYLGEPDALADAFEQESLRGIGKKARYRDPDAVARPSDELERLAPAFQKVSGARLMARHLTRERNQSRSFHATLDGIGQMHTDMQQGERN